MSYYKSYSASLETAMPDHGLVMDGSWKEDLTYGPPKPEMLAEREARIADHRKTYTQLSYDEAAEWVDSVFYTFPRHDGLMKKLTKKSDGTWTWMVHMQYTSAQQRFYDHICTM